MTTTTTTATVFNETQIFKFEDSSDVRIIMREGEPWFVAKDVCDCLGIGNPTESLKGLDNDEKTTLRITEGGPERNIISESGLYSLILRSRKPEAKRFKRWVTHEVIPSIRKHGAYMTPQKLHEVMSEPRNLALLLNKLADEQEKNVVLQEEIKEKDLEINEHKNTITTQQTKIALDAPKVTFANSVITSNTNIPIGTFANILCQNGYNVGQNKLFEILRNNGYLISSGERRNFPVQNYLNMGIFVIEEKPVILSNGNKILSIKTKVTPKGQLYLINKFNAGKIIL